MSLLQTSVTKRSPLKTSVQRSPHGLFMAQIGSLLGLRVKKCKKGVLKSIKAQAFLVQVKPQIAHRGFQKFSIKTEGDLSVLIGPQSFSVQR